jgi:hypothetical protein
MDHHHVVSPDLLIVHGVVCSTRRMDGYEYGGGPATSGKIAESKAGTPAGTNLISFTGRSENPYFYGI